MKEAYPSPSVLSQIRKFHHLQMLSPMSMEDVEMCISDNSKEGASSHSGSTMDADSNRGKELELDMPQNLQEGSTEQLDSALDDKLKPGKLYRQYKIHWKHSGMVSK